MCVFAICFALHAFPFAQLKRNNFVNGCADLGKLTQQCLHAFFCQGSGVLPNGSQPIDASLTVELNEGEPTNIVTIEPGSSATAVAGCITALPGQQATLYFEAQATGGLRETGYLIIHTVPLQGQDTDYPEYSGSQTRAAEWCAAPRWYEPVFLMKNEE